jgi:hypothetical protein
VGRVVTVGEGSGVVEGGGVSVAASVGVIEAVSVEVGTAKVAVACGSVFVAVITGMGPGVAVQAPSIMMSKVARNSLRLIGTF